MQHIVKAQQFSVEFMEKLFDRAAQFKKDPRLARDIGCDRIICNLFYEPSTRTRLSFDVAAKRLGMQVVSTENAKEFSSAIKGETIEDTIRVVAGYGFSAVVLRHHQEGSAKIAADLDVVPIINAGDGSGQHPTQALLDLFTIHERLPLKNLKVVIGGDLARGRTVRSLAYLLAKYPGTQIYFVAPEEFKIGPDIKDYLTRHAVTFQEVSDVDAVLPEANVVYWTRVQVERKTPGGHVIPAARMAEIKEAFRMTEQRVALMRRDAMLMHPLPRVDEIVLAVDRDPRSAYFEQARNGVFVRMALLEQVVGQE